MKIGEIIASQLGGTRRLNAMTGAYNFLLLEDGLSFRLKNPSANYVKIELNGKDLYDVEIGRVRGTSYKIVQEYKDIYNDQLKEVIEMGTGMYLSLEEGGAFGAGHFAEGGILSSSEIEKLDNGFTIEELSEMLNNKFRDSFQFEVYKQGKNRDLTTDYENKLKDDKLKLKFYDKTSGRDLNYEVMQGEENTYFHFLLSDSEYNGYVGTFGFKDRGDVGKEYVTKFAAFLHDAYHYPFSVKHSVMENGGAFGAGHFAEGGAMFDPQTATFFVKDSSGKTLLKTKSLNKASDYYTINKNGISPVSVEAVDANGVMKKLYSNGGAFGAGHFAEGGDIDGFTMQVIRGGGDMGQTEVRTEERKISFEDGGAFGAGHFAKGGSVDKKFVPTVKFQVGDLVWDKGNKRYGTVMNIFDDPINGADGEVRLDSDGMQVIFTYNRKTYENTGYNLIKLGEEGDAGNFTFDKLKETKDSANRLIDSQIKYKDKENEKYYRTVYKRLLDGEFDSKISYKKYIPYENIKTVTIKKGGKELTYKAEDVYNGVYVLEDGGGLKGKAFYTKKADVVKVTLNDGSEVKPVNGFWIKKTAEPITGATTSDADSVFKRIIRDAKLVKVGDSKKYDASDLKKINVGMVEKLLDAGYTEQQIRNKFLGYTHDNEVLADGEFAEYETTIFSYMEDYIPTIIQQLVDAQKSKTFAVTFEYPVFDWSEVIKKYKISTIPKEFVKNKERISRYEYFYQFFQGENIVIDHNYGYKEFDKEGKLIEDTTKDGKKLVNANKLSAWQKERGEKTGFNNGFWTVSSSKIEVIDDVLKMLTSQKDGYCKEIEFYSDYNSELLKENGAKFENGGAFGAGHFARGGKIKVGGDDFTFLLELSDKELENRLDLINKQKSINANQYFEAKDKKENTAKIEEAGIRLDNQWYAIVEARNRKNKNYSNGGAFGAGNFSIFSCKRNMIIADGYETEEDAKKEMYNMFETTSDFSLQIIKNKKSNFANGGAFGAGHFADGGSFGAGNFAQGGLTKKYVNQYFGKGYENDAIVELKKALPNHDFKKGKDSIIVDNGKFIIHLDFGNYGFIRQYSNEGSEGGIAVSKIDEAIMFIEDNSKFAEGGKVTFDEKSAAIARSFAGKKVEPKYQSEYGKTYSKAEAEEVGDKIAGAQKAKYESKPKVTVKKSNGGDVASGNPKMKQANDLAKQIRKSGEKWNEALKRAHAQLKA